MTRWKSVILPLIVLGLMVTACPIKDVPEIHDAEAAIQAAKSAGAQYYAPTKLSAAVAANGDAGEYQQKRRYSKAVEQAKIAKSLAEEARRKSEAATAEMAQKISAAEDAMQAANNANSSKCAPDESTAAQNALSAAKAAQQNNKYAETVNQADTATRLAKQAKAKAENGPGQKIGAAESAINSAHNAQAAKYSKSKLRAAQNALNAARAANQSGNCAEAIKQAELAARLANEARADALAARGQPVETGPRDGHNYSEIFKIVYFNFDSSDIKSEYRPGLDGAARHLLNEETDISIVITGYCDPRGTEEYNMALGERRALDVQQYLVNSGVKASRIRIVSKGEYEQINSSCHSENCWWRERRGAIIVE